MWFLGIPLLAAVALFVVGIVISARALCANPAALTARQRRRVVIVFLAVSVFLAGFANGVAFFMISAAIGGDAVAVRAIGTLLLWREKDECWAVRHRESLARKLDAVIGPGRFLETFVAVIRGRSQAQQRGNQQV